MVNYACAFSQSELGKYFEWIIKLLKANINGKERNRNKDLKTHLGIELETPKQKTAKLKHSIPGVLKYGCFLAPQDSIRAYFDVDNAWFVLFCFSFYSECECLEDYHECNHE